MSALRECPGCGHTTAPYVATPREGVRQVECDECGFCGPEQDTGPAAIAAWNRRAGADEVEKLRAERDAMAKQAGECSAGYETMEREITTLRAELAAAREIEQRSRDFLRWVTSNGFTDPENMLVCAEWENLRTALGATP